MSNGAFWFALSSLLTTLVATYFGYRSLKYKANETYVKGLEARVAEGDARNVDCHHKLGLLEAKYAKLEGMLAARTETAKEATAVAERRAEQAVDAVKEVGKEAVQKLSEAAPIPKEEKKE